jgi:hypothetical protein
MSKGEQISEEPPYPNRLREVRERERFLTREAVIALCRDLQSEQPFIYTTVSQTGLKSLEAGRVRPQMKTAATLAKVMGQEIPSLFPMGLDDPRRNPDGKTTITPNRKKGGRPIK